MRIEGRHGHSPRRHGHSPRRHGYYRDPGGQPEEPSSDQPLGDPSQQVLDQVAREAKVLSDAEQLGPMLNAFWTDELSRLYGITFDPPDRYEYYRGSTNNPCGGDNQAWPNNAYYCPSDYDEYVGFDLDWFQRYLEPHPGGATTFLILAHEWGHAVQDTWLENGGGDTWQPESRKELNADCLAGVFLESSLRNQTIVEEAGDAQAVFGWLYEWGSEDSPWLEPGDHGTRSQRIAAFSDGFRQGTDYCRQAY